MTTYTPEAQVRFVAQWFREWSEMQREDFLPILAQSFSANFCPVNGLSELGLRPPSLFQCRVKLFREWCLAWSEAERQALLDSLKDADPEFVQQFEDTVKSLEGTTKAPDLVANDPREGEVV
ncbi:uncharacterized protein C14orf119 [Neocloeon triangulifer]|uniref:uncharacterized protein C14orf119 n=1 Tax=Neocloeon triangulifer TaxID=2078957 RepID=UPI00286EF2E4|nr:uncharacterized protein C14orf119 [Neocloeon triangulifer]